MQINSEQRVIPPTGEEFEAIRVFITAELNKFMKEYKERGLLPIHVLAVFSTGIATLYPEPLLEHLNCKLSARMVQAITEFNREKLTPPPAIN